MQNLLDLANQVEWLNELLWLYKLLYTLFRSIFISYNWYNERDSIFYKLHDIKKLA